MPSEPAAPQFIIRLINPRKAYWGRIVGGVLTAISFLTVLKVMAPSVTRTVAVIGFAAGFLVPLVLIWLVFQRLTTDLCIIKIAADRLTVCRPEMRQELTVFYNEILTYKDYFFNGNKGLRLRLHDGHFADLKTDPTYQQNSEFYAMVRAFEAAIEAIPKASGEQVKREKSFFEKNVSTYLLVVASLLFGVMWLLILQGKRPVTGSLISSVGIYITYLVSWWVATARRRQK